MLPKKKRVTKDTFQVIMTKGSPSYGSFFVFRYIKQEKPLYAFVVPKKIVKSAVKRNSLRRRGYNILKGYPLLSNIGIFFYKKEALSASLDDIKKDIDSILKKTKSI
jgi:ribonuclease P protein component